jgi:hypothetical protein
MKSKLADELRREQFARYQRMTPAERVALARRLGERGLASFMRTRGLDRAAALREIRRTRQIGRRPSHCMDERDAG